VARAVSVFDVHPVTLEKSFTAAMTVSPTKHLFGHNGTMMTRANSRRTGDGSPIHFAGHDPRGPRLHTGIPAYRHHRAAARRGARRQNSSYSI
jgi:hypothetical protein